MNLSPEQMEGFQRSAKPMNVKHVPLLNSPS
jgi:hypothetical protein